MLGIVAVGTSLPDFIATNDYVIGLAIEQSKRYYDGATTDLERKISLLLTRAGAKKRRWRSGFTKPIEHIEDAWLNCMSSLDAGTIKHIGMVIYCGIDRGVVEPSQASLLAKKFGLATARTLDLIDACMGWFTATQVASRLTPESAPFCVIVSAEFPIEVPGKVYPNCFKIKNDEDLYWKGAALTLGECAAVTVIDTRNQKLPMVFKSANDFADFSGMPFERPDRFVDSPELLPRLSEDCFVSNYMKLTPGTYRCAREVLSQYIEENGVPDFLLTHTVSDTGPKHASRNLLDEVAIRNCFVDVGNIATCSIPVSFELFKCGTMTGVHVAGWISAAGISCSAFRIL